MSALKTAPADPHSAFVAATENVAGLVAPRAPTNVVFKGNVVISLVTNSFRYTSGMALTKDEVRERSRIAGARYRERTRESVRTRARDKKRRDALLPGAAEKQRAANLRKNFGITVEQWDELFVRQNGVCDVCLNPETATLRGVVKR